jgi:DNA-binding transcriptional ArsR family regulator
MKMSQAVKVLAALAQESRLNVFRLLVGAGNEGLAAGDIAARLHLPPATLSFHLKELAATGLIAAKRDGRSLVYSLQPDIVNELMEFLMQDCCKGRPELCQPDFRYGEACCEIVERKKRDKPRHNKAAKSAHRKR